MDNRQEQGFVLLALVTILVPMLLIVGAVTVTMTGRGNEMSQELQRDRALLAAESGVDDAIWRGKVGSLQNGVNYKRSLGSDMAFSVVPTLLLTDGIDNDVDGKIDESDEDVFQVVVTGTYGDTTRQLAAYLAPIPSPSIAVESALAITNPNITIDLKGNNVEISGDDRNIDGSLTGNPSTYGMGAGSDTSGSVATTADLLAELTKKEPAKVTGLGGAPSVGTVSGIDINALVAQVQNTASNVLTSSTYSQLQFGDGAAGTTQITYRNGDVHFSGKSQGAGILLVTGDLRTTGQFRFDGIVIVLGEFNCAAGLATIYGAVVTGPNTSYLKYAGNGNLNYSSEAISLATANTGRYVTFNGWQELSR